MEARFPLDPAPDVHRFPGDPDNCFDLINKYGTYNIQPTNEQENRFPAIMQELPEKWRDMAVGKEELERQQS